MVRGSCLTGEDAKSPPDRLHSLFGHLGGECLRADLLDPQHARSAVAAEDEAEEPGDKIIVPPTIVDVVVLRAVGAARPLVVNAAGADLAPGGLLVTRASQGAPQHWPFHPYPSYIRLSVIIIFVVFP